MPSALRPLLQQGGGRIEHAVHHLLERLAGELAGVPSYREAAVTCLTDESAVSEQDEGV